MVTNRRFARSKAGKREDIGIFVRSSWEANFSRYLNWLQDRGEIVRWEYEPQIFRFPVKRGNKSYTPDFKVWLTDTEYEWREVKGWMDDASRIKLRRFALHFPEESARLELIDSAAYRQLEKEYSAEIAGWE